VGINIAPLVDVVFLLVIFFAVSTTFLETAGLRLELPPSTSRSERETQDVEVQLAADGQLWFEGQEVDAETLRRRLEELLAARERKVVILRADTHTEHGTVVGIMDVIRASGATGLTVAARAEPAGG
jgi:biopolymer transport protein ExbD